MTISYRFRSKLPVVSNLTAMNLWDGVCMFFIFASFIEFILVNYLARWVQDPEQQKKKKDNAILDVRIAIINMLSFLNIDTKSFFSPWLIYNLINISCGMRNNKEFKRSRLE